MDVASERQQFSEARRKHERDGCLSFWLLFVGQATKSNSPTGEIDKLFYLVDAKISDCLIISAACANPALSKASPSNASLKESNNFISSSSNK